MLSINDMGSLGEFFGSIAVFLTLLYLIMEVRLSRRVTMAQIYQQRSDAASSARSQAGSSPSQALAVIHFRTLAYEVGVEAAAAECTPVELAQISFYFSAQLHRIDNIHYQYTNKLIDEELYQATVVNGIKESSQIWRHFNLLGSHRVSFIREIELLEQEAAVKPLL